MKIYEKIFICGFKTSEYHTALLLSLRLGSFLDALWVNDQVDGW